MAWFTRFTRFGDVHNVYAQEADDSCGIACVMMCVYKINKLSPGKAAKYHEDQIYKVYGQQAGGTYDGSSYTYANYLADTLNQLNCGGWKAENVGPSNVSRAIVDTLGVDVLGAGPVFNGLKRGRPIIILTNWTGGGGHFVVVDIVNNFVGDNFASVCDPWDGDVHVQPFKPNAVFQYIGRNQPTSWDTGGMKHKYSTDNVGAMNGWVVRPIG
jgi:hypothetical protein